MFVFPTIALAALPFVVAAPVAPASTAVVPAVLALAETPAPTEDAKPKEDEKKKDEARGTRRERGWVLRGFGKAGTAGLPGLGFGGGLSVGWMRKHFRLDLMGSGRLGRTAWYPGDADVGGAFTLWRAGVRACAVFGEGRIATPLCGGVDSGMVSATGQGQDVGAPRTAREPWASAFADIDMVWHLRPRFGLVATSRWLVPLVRRQYYVGDRGTLVTTPPFGVELGLGVEVVLP